MTLIEELDKQLKAVCPIDGVSIGRWNDPQTWQISFKPTATPGQRAAAQAALQRFDPSTVPPLIDRSVRKADLASANTIADLKAILQDLL